MEPATPRTEQSAAAGMTRSRSSRCSRSVSGCPTPHRHHDAAAFGVLHWDTEAHAWEVAEGRYTIDVGSSSRDLPLSDSFQVAGGGVQGAAVTSPRTVPAGGTTTVTMHVSNPVGGALHGLLVDLHRAAGWSRTTTSPPVSTVAPGDGRGRCLVHGDGAEQRRSGHLRPNRPGLLGRRNTRSDPCAGRDRGRQLTRRLSSSGLMCPTGHGGSGVVHRPPRQP
jgi:hypothetical protein